MISVVARSTQMSEALAIVRGPSGNLRSTRCTGMLKRRDEAGDFNQVVMRSDTLRGGVVCVRPAEAVKGDPSSEREGKAARRGVSAPKG